MIEKCALAIITERGHHVVAPTWSDLGDDESDFLDRHVDEVRVTSNNAQTRGRFRADSTLNDDFTEALNATAEEFVAIADRLVHQLAKAMQSVNSPDCVVALLVRDDGNRTVTLLKLDAQIEAARLEQVGDSVRLEVFQDLLPRPGAIQKALSWPDPRAPHSELIIQDKAMGATPDGTAKYFLNAYDIDASPTSARTEEALTNAITELAPSQVAVAVSAVGQGGDAETVVQRIRAQAPDFDASHHALGGHGAMPGVVRPGYSASAKQTFRADGIELKVPLAAYGRIISRPAGTEWETVIRTDIPLFPPTPTSDLDH